MTALVTGPSFPVDGKVNLDNPIGIEVSSPNSFRYILDLSSHACYPISDMTILSMLSDALLYKSIGRLEPLQFNKDKAIHANSLGCVFPYLIFLF